MSTITYKQNQDKITVYLDGRIAGEIRTVANGYHYFPKGSKQGGEIFATVNAVKQSLEGE